MNKMESITVQQEVIGLCLCLEAINNIANKELLKLLEDSGRPEEAEVLFHSSVHQELFIIRFLDFSKENGEKNLTGVRGSCLDFLKQACLSKSFERGDNIAPLNKAVDELEAWLNCETSIKIWLPTLNVDAEIKVFRKDLVFISGNYCKHNLSRLTGVSKKIHKILLDNEYEVPLELILLALDDFRGHLQENYFIYYGAWLTELLNNIRWGLQIYLKPVYLECHKKDAREELRYFDECPANIQDDLSKEWFRRLMNNIRRGPYLNSFSAPHYLKSRSSLERRD